MGAINDLCTKFEKRVGHAKVNPIVRFRIIQSEKQFRARIKQLVGRETLAPEDIPLVPSNWGYGHEHWLKRYAGYEGDIFATIEHGVYFGDQVLGYGNPIHEEWQIGSIITYGNYRGELLRKAYPNNHIYTIGPYINYAPTNKAFLLELQTKLDNSKRTITLFPAHSVETARRVFDHGSLIEKTLEYARKAECENKMVCLRLIDCESALARRYQEAGFEVVSCGLSSPGFLPRQRAILECSDVTLSNDLGTHVGYSLALGKPHYAIDPIGIDIIDEGLKDLNVLNIDTLRRQKDEFAAIFEADTSCSVSQAQKEFVEYYWGVSAKRDSATVCNILQECEEYGKEYSRSKRLWVQVCNDKGSQRF